MIVTVTPNPSIDRTVMLPAQLVRGAVHRVRSVSTEPGGKGVNVARALTLAGLDTVAILPAAEHDPIVAALKSYGVPFFAVPVDGAVRTNLTITRDQLNATDQAQITDVLDMWLIFQSMDFIFKMRGKLSSTFKQSILFIHVQCGARCRCCERVT